MEHGDQAVQSSRVQSRSHEPVLHGRASLTAPQPLPPFLGLVKIERVRSCTPPSQSLEHLDHPDHLDIKQSTGHLNWLHFLMAMKAGHLMPHSFGLTTASRVKRCTPPQPTPCGHVSSHSTEQASGAHAVTSQSSIFFGAQSVLSFITSFRITVGPQISWLKMYLILSRNMVMVFLCSASNTRFCSSFSASSCWSAFFAAVASASCPTHSSNAAVKLSIWASKSAFKVAQAAALSAIILFNSSTWS